MATRRLDTLLDHSNLEDTFPACDIHSFIFSNPFRPSSPLVSKVNALTGLDNATFPQILPHKPIFCDPISSTVVTQARLKRDTLRLAHGIHQRFGTPRINDTFGSGSRAGPVVLIHLSNCIAWSVIALGFFAAGWRTNPGYTSSELVHVIELCEPQVVICYRSIGGEDNLRAACAKLQHSKVVFLFADPDEDTYGVQVRMSGEHGWISLLSNKELDVSSFAADDVGLRVALLLWTSGTTGKPKGAMMTHRAIIAGLTMTWAGNPGYLPDERWIAVPPFYHVFGLYWIALLAPCIGATAIVVPKFDLEQYLRLVTLYKATHLLVASPIVVALAKSSLLDESWCSLESVVATTAGGASISPGIIQDVWKRTGIAVKDAYGMSETGQITTFRSNRWEDIRPYLGTVGPTCFGIKTTILGENKMPVDSKTQGEIVIHSPSQMVGYLKNPRATAETLHENGVHTGDLGYIKAGNLRITGRLKELIKYKGFQVSPTELEAVITVLPEVQDVAISSVYSKDEATELPLAYVVPRGTAELKLVAPAVYEGTQPKELLALAKKVIMIVEKNCVHYKRLRGGVIIVSTIPKSPSGKTLRSALKNQQGVHIQGYVASRQSRL